MMYFNPLSRMHIPITIYGADYFVNEFRKELNAIVNAKHIAKPNELICFKALINCFESSPYAYAVECHGPKGFITYKNDAYLIGNDKVTCELSDIFFVVFSKNKHIAKYFVMQNKITSDNTSATLESFFAAMNQYVLLNKYLKFNYPREKKGCKTSEYCLLNYDKSLNIHNSVATYGVFYKNNGGWDMATFAANTLCLCNKDNKPKIKSTRKIYYDYKLNGNGFNTAKNLKNFYNSLINLEIGKPIDSIVQKGIINILEKKITKKQKK